MLHDLVARRTERDEVIGVVVPGNTVGLDVVDVEAAVGLSGTAALTGSSVPLPDRLRQCFPSGASVVNRSDFDPEGVVRTDRRVSLATPGAVDFGPFGAVTFGVERQTTPPAFAILTPDGSGVTRLRAVQASVYRGPER